MHTNAETFSCVFASLHDGLLQKCVINFTAISSYPSLNVKDEIGKKKTEGQKIFFTKMLPVERKALPSSRTYPQARGKNFVRIILGYDYKYSSV